MMVSFFLVFTPHPDSFWRNDPIWRAYFQMGLVQPLNHQLANWISGSETNFLGWRWIELGWGFGPWDAQYAKHAQHAQCCLQGTSGGIKKRCRPLGSAMQMWQKIVQSWWWWLCFFKNHPRWWLRMSSNTSSPAVPSFLELEWFHLSQRVHLWDFPQMNMEV